MVVEPGFHVVIVGGGAAGSLAAYQLAKLPTIRHITIVDRTGRFGRGLAYFAASPWHRLNVPISKMGGADDDDPDGFGIWLGKHGDDVGSSYAGTFVARHLYGDYLCDLIAPLSERGLLTQHQGRVQAIKREGEQFHLATADGKTIFADAVVLCLGNQSPSTLSQVVPSARYVNDVWGQEALAKIGSDDDVLVVGTGATAVDAVLEIAHRGHRGRIRMVSRRGLLPLIDAAPVADAHPIDPKSMTLRALTRGLREDVSCKVERGIAWQAVIDAFRPAVSSLWVAMPDDDKRRFMRHLRSLWLVHRHRMAPDVAEHLARLKRDMQLTIIAARLQAATPRDRGYKVTLQPRGTATPAVFEVNWILNCTGPEERYDRVDDELVSSLLKSGQARLGPLGLGLDVDDDCRLVNATGQGQTGIYLVGAPTRGRFWEVTAVPSIRTQVATVVRHVNALSCGTACPKA